MTPYDLYMERAQKQAMIGPALQALNQVVGLPALGALAGTALKFVGRGLGSKAAPSALYRAGQSLETGANKATFAVNKVLNQDTVGGVKLPSMRYDLSKAPGVVRHPANLIGMNTEGPQKLTLQRGAVWAGGAMTLGQMAGGIADAARGPSPMRAAVTPPRVPVAGGSDPMEIKMGAQRQAEEDFAGLMRMMEEI
jgi:hypothetical protein